MASAAANCGDGVGGALSNQWVLDKHNKKVGEMQKSVKITCVTIIVHEAKGNKNKKKKKWRSKNQHTVCVCGSLIRSAYGWLL